MVLRRWYVVSRGLTSVRVMLRCLRAARGLGEAGAAPSGLYPDWASDAPPTRGLFLGSLESYYPVVPAPPAVPPAAEAPGGPATRRRRRAPGRTRRMQGHRECGGKILAVSFRLP